MQKVYNSRKSHSTYLTKNHRATPSQTVSWFAAREYRTAPRPAAPSLPGSDYRLSSYSPPLLQEILPESSSKRILYLLTCIHDRDHIGTASRNCNYSILSVVHILHCHRLTLGKCRLQPKPCCPWPTHLSRYPWSMIPQRIRPTPSSARRSPPHLD